MNKLTKGAVAGVAGIALLLGGAGTFATWNAAAAVSGATINAGTLAVSAAATGTWKDATGSIANLSTYKIVPGAVLTYQQDITITAIGNNLVATLALGPGAITAASSSTADKALAIALGSTAVLSMSTAPGITGSGASYTVSSASLKSPTTVTVSVTINFPKSVTAGAENGSMSGTVSLAKMNVVLTQI